ncbi:MAG: ketoacyl-ACP synthase III [Bdellovibrionales bacterium]|nr:ketoacyl-ACP synthase III [Bdellovibrionales bacterium]
MTLFKAYIKGTGSFFPAKKLTNKDLEKLVDTNDQWIKERTGISSRSIAADNETTSDLAYQASLQAIKSANIKKTDIDFIILATATPDYPMPNTACLVQHKLGIQNCPALDMSAACSGFVYALSVANQFIQTGTYKNILVIGAEVLHNFVNYTDRNTCILFGDGAGATILSRNEQCDDSVNNSINDRGIASHHLGADGSQSDLLEVPAGGSAQVITPEILKNHGHCVVMKGKELFKEAVLSMSQRCTEALEKNNLTNKDIDWVIPHQANTRIINAVAKQLDVPLEKVINEIKNMGNTSAATVPMALDIAVKDGRIKKGHWVLLVAFGSGLTSGSVLLKY